MNQQIEIRRDLLRVMSLVACAIVVLIVIKMYDAKTNEVGKIGEKILKRYVN